MSPTITLVTLIVLLANIVVYPLIWKSKIIIHPGFYFSVTWAISVLSQWFLVDFGVAMLPYPEFVDELHIFVLFSSACFLFFSFAGRKHREKPFKISFIPTKRFYEIFSTVVLISVVLWFLYSGYSLNMAENRFEIVEGKEHVYRSYNMIESFLSIFRSFLPVLAIISGYTLGVTIMKPDKFIISIYILFPFLAATIFAIGTGGRAPILDSIKLYYLGIGLSLPYRLKYDELKKLILAVLIGVIFMSIFSTYVAVKRQQFAGIQRMNYESSFVNAFSGVIDYMSAHYWGYQVRRNEMKNEELYYGATTFYGIFDIRIPFSSQLNLKYSSLAEVFKIADYRLDIYRSNLEASYSTYTIFTPIVRDFGTRGAFIFILIFVYYSHYLFLNLIRKRRNTVLSIIFFYLNFFFWANSTFYSFYGYNIVNSLVIPFFLFHVLNKIKT